MGHTVPSQRRVTEHVIGVLQRYKDSASASEREIIDQFIKDAYKHLGNISYANTYNTWVVVLLSIILEQEKRVRDVDN